MSTPHTTMPVRHYAEDRLVDCACDAALGLPLLHIGRWSEVQFARCCGCGQVEAFIPVGDDPRELDRSGAHRVVPIPEEVRSWLAQWPLLIDRGHDPTGPFWLEAGTVAPGKEVLQCLKHEAMRSSASLDPAQRLRLAGFPEEAAPVSPHAQLHHALVAMDLVRRALQGEVPAEATELLPLLEEQDPRRHAALGALLAHPDRSALIDRVDIPTPAAPWRPLLLLLHWVRPQERQWARYLDQLGAMPLSPVEGIEGLVNESFMLRALLDDVLRSNAPREQLHNCLQHLLRRGEGLDDRLAEELPRMIQLNHHRP